MPTPRPWSSPGPFSLALRRIVGWHADTLSFELSLFGQRTIVNGGTSRYGSGPERLAERSTAAHSTVQIDGADSSEVWGGFRVARRARPFRRKADSPPRTTGPRSGPKRQISMSRTLRIAFGPIVIRTPSWTDSREKRKPIFHEPSGTGQAPIDRRARPPCRPLCRLVPGPLGSPPHRLSAVGQVSAA
ncbi:heparinase II/III-family protein [Thioalkalicoccus limnaeus]|uniref:Heparinase II/III-family protein n=1 Tax=Thioalkalicoccus limnaeus TaxID=120681 RepID=A0ABV4BDH4_9GAMM